MSYGFKSFQDEIELGEGKNGWWKTQRKWLKMKSKYQTFANSMHVDAVYNKFLEPKPDAISPIELFVIDEIENINEKKSIILLCPNYDTQSIFLSQIDFCFDFYPKLINNIRPIARCKMQFVIYLYVSNCSN